MIYNLRRPAGEENRIKNAIKVNLFSSFILFLAAVIVFTTATYAWFSNITSNTVESIDLYVNAADSMMLSPLESPEIDKAADWVVNLTKTDIVSPDRGNQPLAFPSEMSVVSSLFNDVSGKFYTATYNSAGEINGFSDVQQASYYTKASLWVKTTRNGFLYLDADSKVTPLSSELPKSAISDTVRIGIVPVDYDANGIASGGIKTGEDFSHAVIWEPNSTNHLSTDYDGPGGSDKLTTNAVKNAVPFADTIDQINNALSPQLAFDFLQGQTNITGTGFYDSSGTPISLTSNNKIALFNMNMDTMQKFNIYIWVEGGDADTTNAVAKSWFRTYLKFGQEYDKFQGNTFIPNT